MKESSREQIRGRIRRGRLPKCSQTQFINYHQISGCSDGDEKIVGIRVLRKMLPTALCWGHRGASGYGTNQNEGVYAELDPAACKSSDHTQQSGIRIEESLSG